MTTSTTIIGSDTITSRLTAVTADITAKVAKLTALIPQILVRTSVQPVGVIGWIKQARAVVAQIQKIERILGLVATIVAEVAALPGVAIASLIAELIEAISNLQKQIIAKIRAKIDAELGGTHSSDGVSLLTRMQSQLKDCQAALNETNGLFNDIQKL